MGVHYILKQLLKLDEEREKKSLLTLTSCLLSHDNSVYIRSWIDCNRGCFTVVKMIESSSDLNKKKIKIILENAHKQLTKSEKFSGAKILIQKLKEIEN